MLLDYVLLQELLTDSSCRLSLRVKSGSKLIHKKGPLDAFLIINDSMKKIFIFYGGINGFKSARYLCTHKHVSNSNNNSNSNEQLPKKKKRRPQNILKMQVSLQVLAQIF